VVGVRGEGGWEVGWVELEDGGWGGECGRGEFEFVG
jgi:hypothetical protein